MPLEAVYFASTGIPAFPIDRSGKRETNDFNHRSDAYLLRDGRW
jgi:hypothetical protein